MPNIMLNRPYVIPEDGTQVAKSTSAQNTTTVIHTVSDGKRFYLTFCVVTYEQLAAGTPSMAVFVTNASDVLQYNISFAYLPQDFVVSIPMTFIPALQIPSEYKIKCSSSQLLAFTHAFIHGYEA